jgi:TetR/AcrR family transcriptional repressor of lmrAB and yxaGH operons
VSEGARDRMVRSAVVLLARGGVQGASFAEVLAHSKAPRGSVYHHFPAGKAELVAAAIDYMGGQAGSVLDTLAGGSPGDVIDGFIAMWRALLERSGYAVGCSIAGVTVTADSPDLLDRAAAVFRSWRERLAGLLREGGLGEADADGLATMMLAAAEGAVILARAGRSMEPLDVVHAQLRRLAASYLPAG